MCARICCDFRGFTRDASAGILGCNERSLLVRIGAVYLALGGYRSNVGIMKALVLALLLGSAMECVAQGSRVGCETSAATRAVCATEDRLTTALRRNDAASLAQIYADDFRLINYRGTHLDKNAVLNALRTGALRFDSLTVSELRVRMFGDAAVVTGRQHQVAKEPGPDATSHPQDVSFTHVYILRDGTWYLVSTQITPIVLRPAPSTWTILGPMQVTVRHSNHLTSG